MVSVRKCKWDRMPCNASPSAWGNVRCFHALTWLKTLCKCVFCSVSLRRCPWNQQANADCGEARQTLLLQHSTSETIHASALFSSIWTPIMLCAKCNPVYAGSSTHTCAVTLQTLTCLYHWKEKRHRAL